MHIEEQERLNNEFDLINLQNKFKLLLKIKIER